MYSQKHKKSSLSIGKALLVGHLIITLPVFVIIVGLLFGGRALFGFRYFFLFLIAGFILGWLWWSFVTPRWRRWALRGGAPPDKLQEWAVITGLTWPKGWIFEKTEFKVADPCPEVSGNEEAKPASRRPSWISLITGSVGVISLVVVALFVTLFLLVSAFSLKPFQIVGEAMAPTLSQGDKIFITRQVDEVERGDIVVFYHPRKTAYTSLMRVIALPNETIRVDGKGQVYINNHPIEESYAVAQSSQNMDIVPEQTIGPGEYWVMGDNRDNSYDSRDWGTVPGKLIYGKALWRYWPFTKIGMVK